MNDINPVMYASPMGVTAGVAEAIGKSLVESGLQVEVRPHASNDRSLLLPGDDDG